MPLETKDLKACYLIGYKVSVHGGIHYEHSGEEKSTNGTAEFASWQTDKEVNDAAEYKRAQALRNKAKRYLNKLGVSNELGVVVPVENLQQIKDTYRSLSVEVDRFNVEAIFSSIRFRVLRFKIEGENEVALQDMLADMRSNLVDLKAAVKKADVKGIRDVIQRMKGMEMVLPDSAADFVQRAVDDARAQATEMRKALEERKEDLEVVQRRISTSSVDFARFALMEPGSDLLDVDTELVQRMVERDALNRGAGVLLAEEDEAPQPQTEERAQVNGSPVLSPIFGNEDELFDD